jgi:hypothetical protein
MKSTFLYLSILVLLSSCAQLHHVQIGEIVSHPNYTQQPFDIKISETGVNIQEAGKISKAVLDDNNGKNAAGIAGLIGLFQMGPQTGNPVYSKDYARNLMQLIYEKCPSGKVTGLTSVRESRKYPVISGEIVKVTGFCLIRKGG